MRPAGPLQYLCNGLEEDIEARKAAAGHTASELDLLVQVGFCRAFFRQNVQTPQWTCCC